MSSYPNPYSPKYLAVSQTLLLVLAIANSFLPKYFFLFYILYLVGTFAFIGVFTYRTNPMIKDRGLMKEVMTSRSLHEEKNVQDLIMNDKEYVKELTSQSSKMLKYMLFLLVYTIAVILVYDDVLIKVINSPAFKANDIYRFVVYVIYFEALFGISFIMSRRVFRMGNVNKVAPNSYKITEKGVVGNGFPAVTIHGSHLANAEIRVDPQNKYVEIIPSEASKKSVPYTVRLYSNDVNRVKELLERVKKISLKRGT
jgi:uncharacterized membrane protein